MKPFISPWRKPFLHALWCVLFSTFNVTLAQTEVTVPPSLGSGTAASARPESALEKPILIEYIGSPAADLPPLLELAQPVKVPKIPNSVAVPEILIRQDQPNASDPALPAIQAFRDKPFISITDLRILSTYMVAQLIKSGYQVIEPATAKPSSPSSADSNHIRERITRGDFFDAEYVLQGNVVSADSKRTSNPITGTMDYSHKLVNSVVVEFKLIHTETFQMKTAFYVMGHGSDMYIGKEDTYLAPSANKVYRALLTSLSADAQQKLQDHLPPIVKEGSVLSNILPASKPEAGSGDPSTLMIYAPSKSKAAGDSSEDKPPVTVYQK